MDFKEEGMKLLKENLETLGASKHDIDVTLDFNDTALENIYTFIRELDNPVIAEHSLRVLSNVMLALATHINLFGNKGDTNK